MLEKTIERHLVMAVKKLGGISYKFTSPGRRSVPDRICILPGGTVVFVEVKAPGKKPTELQALEIKKIRGMGCQVVVLNSIAAVKEVFGE